MLVKFKCFRRRSTDLFSYILALLKVSVATNDHVDLIKRSNDDDDDEEKKYFSREASEAWMGRFFVMAQAMKQSPGRKKRIQNFLFLLAKLELTNKWTAQQTYSQIAKQPDSQTAK